MYLMKKTYTFIDAVNGGHWEEAKTLLVSGNFVKDSKVHFKLPNSENYEIIDDMVSAISPTALIIDENEVHCYIVWAVAAIPHRDESFGGAIYEINYVKDKDDWKISGVYGAR